MSGVDTAWLRMDRPENLMMIVGIEIFEEPIAYEVLCRRLREKFLAFDRFRQKVVEDAAGYWWEDDEDFRLEHHVRRVRLPKGGGDPHLRKLVGQLASEPLDRNRPLWQFHLVENYNGTNAVIVRIHHCIADGIALTRVTLSMSDHPLDGPPPRGRAAARAGRAGPTHDPEHEGWHAFTHLFDPIVHTAAQALESTGSALAKSLELAGDPQRAVELAGVGSRLLRDAAKIALMLEDSRTPLKGKPRGEKVVAWNEALPLVEVKAVSRALGVSVNDVLLSCVAGAIHRYLEEEGDDTAGKEIRAMVPVNLRPPDEPLSLGNRFGLVPLTLPVGIPNPLERVYDVRRRMNELKEGFQGPIAFALLSALGYTPKPVQEALLDYLASKGTAVMTNVPGAQVPIRFFGIALKRLIFWVPQSGNIGVGVSILSYNGNVQFGLITDTAVCEEPQRIIDHFGPEFERLVLMLSMMPREAVAPAGKPAVSRKRATPATPGKQATSATPGKGATPATPGKGGKPAAARRSGSGAKAGTAGKAPGPAKRRAATRATKAAAG
jgi:WS/DGAT/MGAT family acyltransferase